MSRKCMRTRGMRSPRVREGSVQEYAEDGHLLLFILRHGEAGTRMIDPATDYDRALTSEGMTEMRRIGRTLRELRLGATQIVTSPLRRARETAEVAASALKILVLEEWDELRPDGNREFLYRKLARLERGSRVILVGHEPYLTSMIGEIIGASESRLVLKKGGLAKVRIDTFAPRIRGELRWLLTPKLLSRMS